MSFSIEVEKKEKEVRLYLMGELDITTIAEFNDSLKQIEDCEKVVIDFSKITFMDSTGIGSIMEVIYLSQSEGFSLLFENLNEELQEVFETVGLFQLLKVVQGENGA
ncbi:STAS domain-containing protein [Salirhabdus salicampi]|uniref:STAS domain-containing protein n=1 Tax=Salirhabdus salicampi TaxID=476102 RepID=UPI0020C473DE|nr:STAS domain-containing protein [Salirhabdus salicampi]MCP8615729.1 STAS domain-containing protein [Salirhabdus salicampi]